MERSIERDVARSEFNTRTIEHNGARTEVKARTRKRLEAIVDVTSRTNGHEDSLVEHVEPMIERDVARVEAGDRATLGDEASEKSSAYN